MKEVMLVKLHFVYFNYYFLFTLQQFIVRWGGVVNVNSYDK